MEEIDDDGNSNEGVPNQYSPKRVTAMNGFVVDNVACGGCHTLLTATKGSNADFTNNDFNIVNENRQISLTELPPLQKVPGMIKTDEPLTNKDVANSNAGEHVNVDNVNGNTNEETGSIDSLEANVSGSHIVNINDLEADSGSTHDVADIIKDEANPIKAEVTNAIAKMDTAIKDAGGHIENTAKEMQDKIEGTTKEMKDKIGDVTQDMKDKMESTVNEVKDKVQEKVQVVEEILKKTDASDPGLHIDEKKVLKIPDKIAEIANSPPPKTPILPELLHLPDLTHMSPVLSKHSDDGQKSENGQSENETIPCGSDKSSPQAGKTKTQAVMPILRSEDSIDIPNEPDSGEDTDVVVNKMEEKGRFARIFSSIRDKENSCMGKGKVIEEKVVGKFTMFIFIGQSLSSALAT